SHDFWQSRFGSDPGVVGRVLTINSQPLQVIGIAPAGFSGTQIGARIRIFVPMTMHWQLDAFGPSDTPENRRFRFARLFARLRDGITATQAAALLNTVYARIVKAEGPQSARMQQYLSRPLDLAPGARGQGTMQGASPPLTLLLAVTLLVLLIVCVNVANLLLMRGASRAGEIAIRQSMGARRGRLIAELLSETAFPAAIGGILSLPVAAATLAAVAPILPASLAEGLGMHVGGAAVLFAALATVASVLVFGLFPALRASHTDPAIVMKSHAAQALRGQGGARLRAALVTAQIAFSMVLLVLAGLFAESLGNIARIDLGMDVDSLVSFSVSPGSNGYDAPRSRALYERITEALAAQPGVTAVGSAVLPVVTGANNSAPIQVEGFDNGGKRLFANFNFVGPSFFQTLSIPLLAGRTFAAADFATAPRAAIVNERFVRTYGLGRNAIGKLITFPGNLRFEIVGVVANAAYSQVKGEGPPQFFLPRGRLDGSPFAGQEASSSFYVRAAIDPDALLKVIPRVVAGIDPTLPVTHLITMRQQVKQDIFVDRLVSILSASFAGLATLLAAIGLYGVMAYNVTARTREMGLRLALGAEPADLRVMVLKRVGGMAVIGLSVGLVAAIGAGRAAEALLYGLTGHDPVVLVGAALVLAAVVLAASYWPARRASSIAPMEALRHE
ncbi:MAG TPA: FtsX-like permease family protein, partial [Gammaproteobacteria bacterium]|nr:FtsX-like permease family protein [Gammaproteobacteria bacterium]